MDISNNFDLPVKTTFTGKPVKQFYRFLPVIYLYKSPPYSKQTKYICYFLRISREQKKFLV